jgi:molecular chaperone GrpE
MINEDLKEKDEIKEELKNEVNTASTDNNAGTEAGNAMHEDEKSGKKSKKHKKEDEKKDKEIEELKGKVNELNDKYLRLSAEFDNYRKRTLKERTDLLKTAGGETLVSLLPVIDDLERALQSIEKATEVEPVKEGIGLIYNKFKEFMKNKGLVEVDALNQPFDTDLHEALTKIPAPNEDLKGKVVDVIQKGYRIEDKIIRYAKVVVGE